MNAAFGGGLTGQQKGFTLKGSTGQAAGGEGGNGNDGFHPLTVRDNLSIFKEFAADRVRRKL
jgi:hypothetical protein